MRKKTGSAKPAQFKQSPLENPLRPLLREGETDGPFAETKELIAGFWLIQVRSREEAIEWAKRIPFEDGEVEIRQVFELEDFPTDPAEESEGWRQKEQRFREEQQRKATKP